MQVEWAQFVRGVTRVGLSGTLSPSSRHLLELEGQKNFDYKWFCELLAILFFKI